VIGATATADRAVTIAAPVDRAMIADRVRIVVRAARVVEIAARAASAKAASVKAAGTTGPSPSSAPRS